MSNSRVILAVVLVLSLGALMFSCSDDAQQNPSPVASNAPLTPPALQMGSGGNLSGAIFTTTPDGGIVNENVHYQSKLEVYLDGGPGNNAPQHAAALPDGWYVFQVTDPPGKVLLSEDPSKCRVVEIDNGVIVRLVDPSEFGMTCEYTVGKGGNAVTYPCHIQDDPDGVAGSSGRHDTNTDADHGDNGAIVVQLMPFLDTPNPGGVYKAWLTPFDAYLSMGGNLEAMPVETKVKGKVVGFENDPGFGPPRNMVKTDNFKVKERPPRICVLKYEDMNGNGIKDEGEPEITGWPIYITETLHDGTTVTNVVYTPACKAIDYGMTVRVEEDLPEGWGLSYVLLDGVTVANPSTVIDVSFGPSQMDRTVTFGNYEEIPKSGVKWHDLDADGEKEAGEPYLTGWKIKINGTDGMGTPYQAETLTDVDGKYKFVVPPGSYTVSEVCEAGWYQSHPAPTDGCGSGVYNVVFLSGDVDDGNDFGNYKPCKITVKKYWDKNKNDQKDADEPYLAGFEFCLYDAAGNLVSADDFLATPDPACQVTDVSGVVFWDNLRPGTYTIKESPKDGWVATGDTEKTLTCKSGDDVDRMFGNVPNPVDIKAKKYNDCDADGIKDANEPYAAGFEFCLYDAGGNLVSAEDFFESPQPACKLTGDDGIAAWTGLIPGEYTIVESEKSGWVASTPTSKTFDLDSGESGLIVVGNYQPVSVTIFKFHDFNANGVRDYDEPYVEGFEFCLKDAAGNLVSADDFVGTPDPACQVTGAEGMVSWDDLKPAVYTVVETQKPNWDPTTGTSKMFDFTDCSAARDQSFEFGNILMLCRVTGGQVDESGNCSLCPEGASGLNRYTCGGQAGASTALQPQPSGEWTHSNKTGPAGKFTFHAGTASAPDGTEIDWISCSDPVNCDPARHAPAKQIDFGGVGTFKNMTGTVPDEIAQWVSVGSSLHYFEVNIDDLGEPGAGGWTDPDTGLCPADGFGLNGSRASGVCACPDFYRIRIYATSSPSSQVIYEVQGYIAGGNFQIHPLTGHDTH